MREFNKDKSQQTLDKLFKELRGFENPFQLKLVKDKYKPRKKR